MKAGHMDSTRQSKVARLLQKELGQIFQKMGKDSRGKLYTVTVVRISPDLSVARVYLSIFPVKKDEDPLGSVREHASQIRYELGRKVKNQLRIIPELHFFIDDSLDYIDNIENLLKT
jgi:ribosome-binding factor A